MLTRKHFREAAKLVGDLDPERPLTREDVAKIRGVFPIREPSVPIREVPRGHRDYNH